MSCSCCWSVCQLAEAGQQQRGAQGAQQIIQSNQENSIFYDKQMLSIVIKLGCTATCMINITHCKDWKVNDDLVPPCAWSDRLESGSASSAPVYINTMRLMF